VVGLGRRLLSQVPGADVQLLGHNIVLWLLIRLVMILGWRCEQTPKVALQARRDAALRLLVPLVGVGR